jgi:hypothetical protein
MLIVKFSTQYQIQVSRFDCKSTVDLPYNDWVCSGPLKNVMTKYVNVSAVILDASQKMDV